MAYILDKLVVLFRLPKVVANDLVRFWTIDDHFYCDIVKSWHGYHPALMQDNYTLQTEQGISFYLGFGTYGRDYTSNNMDAKLEFNPAKVGNSAWFKNLYYLLVQRAKFIDFRRFDVAIDLPVSRTQLRMLKDNRKYTLLDYGGEDRTEYLGVRSAHGNCKLYNKALEMKIARNLTRLELTLDYSNSAWNEFERIFPRVLDLHSISPPDGLHGTDKVLYLARAADPALLRELPFRTKKKIEQLLATTAQFIKPDKTSYESILTEILTFGNIVDVEKWVNLYDTDEELPEEWTKPKMFIADEGEQQKF